MLDKKWLIGLVSAVVLVVGIFAVVGSNDSDDNKDSDSEVKGTSEIAESGDPSEDLKFKSMAPRSFKALLDSGDMALVDIRTEEEHAEARIAESIVLDYYQTEVFKSELENLNKEATYLIYCRTGNRSSSAMEMMEEMGFQEVYDLQGGIQAWQSAGYSVISG